LQQNRNFTLHYGKQRPVSAKEAARQAQGWKKVRWREGSKGWLESGFWAGRVQPSHGFHEGREAGKEVWLVVEWPATTEEPTKYFFCDLPANYSLRRLVQVAKARWKIEQDYQQLKEELGLDHYEGRSWSGWHHQLFDTGDTPQQKKLLAGPCRGRVVRFSGYSVPGLALAATAAAP
jgi:SRSO17 transposase